MKSCFSVFAIVFLLSCNSTITKIKDVSKQLPKAKPDSVQYAPVADLTTILAKKEIPVLCYHHIRNTTPGDYVVTPASFAAQMNALADSGYKTILPDQLYNYLTQGLLLPQKSVMITFDDTDVEQFNLGAAEMNRHDFKGVFFIMNISIGRSRYMNKEQIRQLSDNGNVVEAHTWDHHKVTEYTNADWDKQLNDAKQKLEIITGKPVKYFAYPFGLWNKAAIPELQNRGIIMAFELSSKRDTTLPLYTIRRMLVPGTWSTNGLFKAMKATFHL